MFFLKKNDSTNEESESKNNLPDNFLHLKQSLTFLKGSFGERNRKIVGEYGALGVRYSYGPVAIEYYTCDKEPSLETFKGFRFIIWDRILNKNKPKNWRQMILGFGLSTSVIVDVSKEEYWKDWTKTFRQYRAKWETQTEYEILKISRDEFAVYYEKFGRPRDTINTCISILDKHLNEESERVNLFILKNKLNDDVVGGIGTVDASEVNQSYYLIAFSDKEKAPPANGLWLLNNWFLYCKNSNIRFANLGVIWTPGHNKKWKGFSEFKMYFRPVVVTYQRPLFRFTFNKA